ncbi:MAG: hypothetical protein ACFFAZ_15110 [Promethearchaeota archaeon]
MSNIKITRLLLASASVVLTLSILALPISSAIVWSEDFEVSSTEELDDWTLQGYQYVFSSFLQVDHGFTISDGALMAEDVYVDWSVYLSQVRRAIHQSAVAYGNWSFDWRVSDSGAAYDSVEFMFTDLRDDYNLTGEFSGYAMTGYTIILDTVQNNEIYIERFDVTEGVKLIRHSFDTTLSGWHHIDITRDLSGVFNVYFDSELVLNVTDNTVTTCETFNFVSFQGNSSIDNLVVSDINAIDTTTLLLVGAGFAIAVVVIVIYMKRRT